MLDFILLGIQLICGDCSSNWHSMLVDHKASNNNDYIENALMRGGGLFISKTLRWGRERRGVIKQSSDLLRVKTSHSFWNRSKLY